MRGNLALGAPKGLGAAMIKRPLIGLTLDAEPAGGWSKYPWYALRQNYCRRDRGRRRAAAGAAA